MTYIAGTHMVRLSRIRIAEHDCLSSREIPGLLSGLRKELTTPITPVDHHSRNYILTIVWRQLFTCSLSSTSLPRSLREPERAETPRPRARKHEVQNAIRILFNDIRTNGHGHEGDEEALSGDGYGDEEGEGEGEGEGEETVTVRR